MTDRQHADTSILIAETDAQVAACFPTIKQLRPHLDLQEYLTRTKRMMADGYSLAYISNPAFACVAGYRQFEMLATGRVLYVDDLITSSEYRSHGFGKTMIAWLRALAIQSNCQFLELDSGVSRTDAHKFYRNNGLDVVAQHFSVQALSKEGWSEQCQQKG